MNQRRPGARERRRKGFPAGMSLAEPLSLNSVTVESPYGLRSFALRAGDVTAAPDPVLVVPTHANEAFPPDGEVLTAAVERFGAQFDRLEPIVRGDGPVGTYRVIERGRFPGLEILVVRIPGEYSVTRSGDEPLDILGKALWTLFGSLAALELRERGLISVALPLLAGTRGYPVRDLLTVLLRHSLNWLRASRSMGAVNLYLMDDEALAEWSTVMDDVLGRRSVDAAQNALVAAFRAELLALLGSPQVTRLPSVWQPVLASLRASLELPKIPLERIAVNARVLAELIVVTLVMEQPGPPARPTLATGIVFLRGRNCVAPWILSHLDGLRNFGNAAAHPGVNVSYEPSALREEDMASLLASLHRVIQFTTAW
jgi:hypothetical protein